MTSMTPSTDLDDPGPEVGIDSAGETAVGDGIDHEGSVGLVTRSHVQARSCTGSRAQELCDSHLLLQQ